jgi:YHS domain-containing protein
MNILNDSLAASALAVVIAGAVPNPAGASEKALFDPAQIARPHGLIVLAEGEKKSKHHVQVKVMLKGYDPVAYFKQGKAVRGKRSISSTYNGVTYFFASESDKTDFDKSPEKFKPQYGGFCANSMSKGRRADIDPKVFRVYKDKLYVCRTPAALEEFSANLDTNISKADKNWLQIGPSTYNSETRGFEEPWPFGPERNPQ